MMLVTQADNTSHLALLSGIKYKVCEISEKFAEAAISTHSSCWTSWDEWWRHICPLREPPARKWSRKWPPADKTWAEKNGGNKTAEKWEHSGLFPVRNKSSDADKSLSLWDLACINEGKKKRREVWMWQKPEKDICVLMGSLQFFYSTGQRFFTLSGREGWYGVWLL